MKLSLKIIFTLLISFFINIHTYASENRQKSEYIYRYLGFKIYKAFLEIPKECIYPECNFSLSLTYFRDFKGVDIAKKSVEEISKQKKLSSQKEQQYLKTLSQIFPNIAEGDTLTGTMKNKKAYFYHNNKPIGHINNAELALDFFNIWLSDKTSEPKMRSALL
jgi:hypothetical protein